MRLDRLNTMEQYVLQHGTASLEELTEYFDVSTNTIRRDLNELLGRGRIKKVYGGVSAISDASPLPMSVRTAKNSPGKQLIGDLAAQLIEDNTAVFLDSGSTVVHLIPHLASHNGITVVTHSLSALYEASKFPSLKVIALGGMYNPVTSSYTGITTLESLSRISVHTVFIAATGVSLERGLTNTTYLEAEIKRSVTENNKNIVLMADHTKFDYSSVLTFCKFEDLRAVVTDIKPSEPYMKVIQEHGIKLLCGE